MLELAEIKKDDVVYDLGCGDGRIVVITLRADAAECRGQNAGVGRDQKRRRGLRPRLRRWPHRRHNSSCRRRRMSWTKCWSWPRSKKTTWFTTSAAAMAASSS